MLGSRRFIIGLMALGCLTALGFAKDQEVGLHIAAVVASIAAANAFEKKEK